MVFLKLVNAESQVNHKTQLFWVKVVHLVSNVAIYLGLRMHQFQKYRMLKNDVYGFFKSKSARAVQTSFKEKETLILVFNSKMKPCFFFFFFAHSNSCLDRKVRQHTGYFSKTMHIEVSFFYHYIVE